MHSLKGPNSSPTTLDFQGGGGRHHRRRTPRGHHVQWQHRHAQHSRQPCFRSGNNAGSGGGSGYSRTGDGSLDSLYDRPRDLPHPGRPSTKRQRLNDRVGVNGMSDGVGGLVGGSGGATACELLRRMDEKSHKLKLPISQNLCVWRIIAFLTVHAWFGRSFKWPTWKITTAISSTDTFKTGNTRSVIQGVSAY